MKNQFIILVLLVSLAGCDVFRPAARNTDNLSGGNPGQVTSNNSDPRFIKDISTETSRNSGSGGNSSKSSGTPVYKVNDSRNLLSDDGNAGFDPLQFKYAILTNSPVEELTNQRLLNFMDQWYGVPYQYGGCNKDGIDCSAFTSLLMSTVYNVNQLPRMSADQYHATQRVSRKNLREGDLVFFHTMGKGHKVTHVGVYLYNNRFVHASVAGVQISDLGEGYYMNHYVGAGRILGSDRIY